MKRSYLTVLVFLFGFQLAMAQESTSLEDAGMQISNNVEIKNVAYLEAGGAGGIYSVNFERRLRGDLWGRAGVGYIPSSEIYFFSVPVSFSYLIGSGTSYFEVGLGATYLELENFELNFYPDEERNDTEQSIVVTGTIGYRYQPQQKGFFFRAALTPLSVAPWAGLSFGYSF